MLIKIKFYTVSICYNIWSFCTPPPPPRKANKSFVILSQVLGPERIQLTQRLIFTKSVRWWLLELGLGENSSSFVCITCGNLDKSLRIHFLILWDAMGLILFSSSTARHNWGSIQKCLAQPLTWQVFIDHVLHAQDSAQDIIVSKTQLLRGADGVVGKMLSTMINSLLAIPIFKMEFKM